MTPYRILPTWSPQTASDIGPSLTCREADDLAGLFRSSGRDDLAYALLEGHLEADDPTDAHLAEDAG